MTDKVFANGGKQNNPEFAQERAGFDKVATNVAQGVGAATLVAAGIKLAGASAEVWNSMVATSSPADGMLEKFFTTGGLATGAVGTAAGAALVATGAYAAYKLAKDTHLKRKFLRAVAKAKNTKIGQACNKFVQAAKRHFADGPDVMPVYVGDKYQYSVDNQGTVKQLPKAVKNFVNRKLNRGR